MSREIRAKELAVEILELCENKNPGEILTALVLASAQVVSDVCRDDVGNAELVAAYANTFRSALGQMRNGPGETLQ